MRTDATTRLIELDRLLQELGFMEVAIALLGQLVADIEIAVFGQA